MVVICGETRNKSVLGEGEKMQIYKVKHSQKKPADMSFRWVLKMTLHLYNEFLLISLTLLLSDIYYQKTLKIVTSFTTDLCNPNSPYILTP